MKFLCVFFLVCVLYQVYAGETVLKDGSCDFGFQCKAGINSCCVANNQPRGKRQTKTSTAAGHCEARPKANEPCIFVENNTFTGSLASTVFFCPCTWDSECVKDPNGFRLIPIGFSGRCVRKFPVNRH